MHPKIRLLLLTVLTVWVILLTLVSLSPVIRSRLGIMTGRPARIIRRKLGLALPGTPSQFAERRNHRLSHLVSFGVISFLLVLLARNQFQRNLALAAVVALGAFIEVSQHLLYSNPLETWDVRDDIYGALAGFAGATLVAFVNRKGRTRKTPVAKV